VEKIPHNKEAAVELRSWVQIPPGPFYHSSKIRYSFEFNFNECKTKSLTMPMPVLTVQV
jgi:hypothetical protein